MRTNAEVVLADTSTFIILPTGDCLAFGNNAGGQLGLGHNQQVSQPTPVKLPNGEKFRSVFTSGGMTFFISESDKHFVCGVEIHGLLGLDFFNKVHSPIPLLLPDNEIIRFVSIKENVNDRHIIVCSENDQWYVCGPNREGQLGLGHKDLVPELTRITLPEKEKIDSIEMNEDASFIHGESKRWFVCGDNKYGQLGIRGNSNKLGSLSIPKENHTDEDAILIGTNGQRTYMIDHQGRLYACGENRDGKLGISQKERLSSEVHLWVPTPVALPQDERAELVNVYDDFVLIRCSSGAWYAQGKNDDGQLGLEHNKLVRFPTQILLPDNEKIASVSCNGDSVIGYSTFFRTKNDDWFACGDNTHGQLGLGHNKSVHTPTRIILPNKEKIKSLRMYRHSTFVCAESGEWYVSGHNDIGQLALGHNNNVNTFTRITLPDNKKIKSLTTNGYVTFIFNEDDELYVCGDNYRHRLGFASDGNVIALTRVPLPDTFSPSLSASQQNEIDLFIAQAKAQYPENTAQFLAHFFLAYANYQSFFSQHLPHHELAKKIAESLADLKDGHDYVACMRSIDKNIQPSIQELTQHHRDDAVDLLCLWKTIYVKAFQDQVKQTVDDNIQQASKALRLTDETIPLSREARAEQISISRQLDEMTKELEAYQQGLSLEIQGDITKHEVFYQQFFKDEDTVNNSRVNILSDKLDQLRKCEEGILTPRKQNEEASSVINDAILKYKKVGVILNTLRDQNKPQKKVMEDSIAAINDALPDMEKSRDSLGMKILKGLLAFLTAGIAALFLYRTKGAKLVSNHLTKLSLFTQPGQKPVEDEKGLGAKYGHS